MGGNKKRGSAKSWALAGEPVYSTPLSPTEERAFKESVSSLRSSAARIREDSPIFSQNISAMKQGAQAARASLGYFFKYFDGKYRRTDIVEALAKAAALPGPVVSLCNSSCGYMLGAALWLLDYARQRNLWHKLVPLLPAELSEETDYMTPAVDDLMYSRDDMLGVMTVFIGRKKDQRQAFRKIWNLVDNETAVKLKTRFRDTLLDYLDRYLEVCSRVKPSVKPDARTPLSPLARPAPFGDQLEIGALSSYGNENPIRTHADMWFLMNTAELIGQSSDVVREALHFRRSSELLMGFHVQDPYAVCAAYLLLERDGDVLANLNMLTVNVLACAERHLPWGASEAFDYAVTAENGTPDYELRYPVHQEEEGPSLTDLPVSDIEEGALLSESPLFYLATGYALPRELVPSRRLKNWFMEQGPPEARAEALTWGAWFSTYVDGMREFEPPVYDELEDFVKPQNKEPAEAPEKADQTSQVTELTRQLKEARKTLYESERNARNLQERLHSVEAEALRDRAELSQLRETLFQLRMREGQPEDSRETEIEFPYQTDRRIVAFGGHETWQKAIRPMLPGVRFFDREMLPDINAIKSADVVWIQSNALAHPFYYRIIDMARKENISVRYFGFASARKCAEQLVMDEVAAAE